MISRAVDEGSAYVVAEDADDLLSLRRVIREGDRVTGDTTRAVRREREYARPDRGERVRVRIALLVERVALDSAVDRLRVGGTILESGNEEIPRGSHHSMLIKVSEPYTVWKRRWTPVERRLIGRKGAGGGFVLVAMDRSDCGVGRLAGTHLEVMPNIYSGAGGKRYKTEFDAGRFFRAARDAVAAAARPGDRVIVFGPGETKRRFANFAGGGGAPGPGIPDMAVVEGIDAGGEDGIYTFTKSAAMREAMSGSKLARISAVVDDVMRMAGRRGRRFAMGFAEAARANERGAVESLVFSDRAFEEAGEEEVIRLLNDAESKGAQVFSVDSSTDLGLRVAGLGGIVSTLRFAVGADG